MWVWKLVCIWVAIEMVCILLCGIVGAEDFGCVMEL